MLDQWYHPIHIPMTIEQFHRLPRNPAYKYEYIDGQAWLTPRPRTFNALLELKAQSVRDHTGERLAIRSLTSADWSRLPKLFAAAFERVPPFSSLTPPDRLSAAT